MENYVRVAQSLVAEQARLADAHPSEFAGLAWIGYHPPMPDVRAFEVFSDDRAATGAVALSDDLKALRSARSERGQSRRLALRSVDRNGHREIQLRQPLRPRGHLRTPAAVVLLAGTDRHPAFDALIV